MVLLYKFTISLENQLLVFRNIYRNLKNKSRVAPEYFLDDLQTQVSPVFFRIYIFSYLLFFFFFPQIMEVWPHKKATDLRRNKAEVFDIPSNYTVSKKPLGSGSYSTVFECKNNKTSKHYAAKRYRKRDVFGLEDMLQNEFQVLKSVSQGHKHILNLIDYFETENHIFLVTDLAKGGELFERVINAPGYKLPEIEARRLTKQLVDTIDYLHLNNIVHRDIKAENVLYKTKHHTNILLADFGSARVLPNNSKLTDKCGTISYMAPEMIEKQPHGFPVDMWSLGVIVYFMVCGYMPFDCETDEETTEAIKKADFMFEPPEYWSNISDDCKEFIRKCFIVNPEDRMTAGEALSHPFLTTSTTTLASPALTRYSSYQNLTNSLMSNTTLANSVNTLTTSNSNLSLVAKLRDSLQALQNEQPAFELDDSLRGAMCMSPSVASRLSSPTHSSSVSRAQSSERVALEKDNFAKHDTVGKGYFYI